MKLQLKVLSMILMGASSATLLCAQDEQAKPAPSRSIVTPSAASVEQITNRLKATSGNASGQVAEIAKMSDAGVDEKSILVYIDGLPQSRVKADDIIYLHDKGISTTVINAWLQHANAAPAQQAQIVAAAPTAQAPVQNAPVVQAPATPPTSTPVYVSPEPAPAYTGPTVIYTSPSYSYPYYYPYYGGPYISLGFYGRPFYGFRGGFYPHHFVGGHTFVHGGFHTGGGFRTGGFHR